MRYVTHGGAGRGDGRQVQVLAVPAVADWALLLSAPAHMNNDTHSVPASVAVSLTLTRVQHFHVSGACLSVPAGSCWALPSLGALVAWAVNFYHCLCEDTIAHC